MSEPDPLQPIAGATGVLRGVTDDATFEADFADLAARFAAQSGGGLSPELSADLALEIVLNEVVEQACLATGATGAAIVLPRDGELVCRASSGATAPELGARIDATSGLSGTCIQTRVVQRCDDVLADARADVSALEHFGVRSVMAMPLLRRTEVVGVFELFSSLPAAFGERDERTLEVLASRVLSNLESAARPLPPPSPLRIEPLPISGPQPVPASMQANRNDPAEDAPRSRFALVNWALRVAIVLCAVALGMLLLRSPARERARERPHLGATAAAAGKAGAEGPQVDAAAAKHAVEATSQTSTSVPSPASPRVLAGGLSVFENGREVFRMPAGQSQFASVEPAAGVQRASTVEPEKAGEVPRATEGTLLYRVEPEYPEEARQQQVQGMVMLDVHIGSDGAVQDVAVVSGPPQLAQASIDAVKKWRFRGSNMNGQGVEMQTRVTLNFRLPH